MVAARSRATAGRMSGHAAAGSVVLVVQSAANAAGVRIPSAEWGRRVL